MKLVIQRVSSASVEVDNSVIGKISNGFLVYVGISKDYTESKLDWMVNKLLHLRAWSSKEKGFDLNIQQVKGEILVISQFTLYGDCSSGHKPKFNNAKEFDEAREIYNSFVERLKKTGLNIQTGEFGAKMKVSSVNEGPVTLIVEK